MATDYVSLIVQLAPLIINGAPIVAKMIADISSQSGKPIDEIIADTLTGLDETDAKAIADMAQEQAAIDRGEK